MALESTRKEPPVAWVSYKSYAGCKINGTVAVVKPTSDRHMDRAYYLTTQLEAPLYGAVQSYDGAGLSGGPLHNIAVYPLSMAQGSLFSLLQWMETHTAPPTSLLMLREAYRACRWQITKNGLLKHVVTNRLISGKEIRDEFTPSGGKVPKSGPSWLQAKRWALLHHHVFAEASLFEAQKEFAINWLLSTCKAQEDLFYQGRKAQDLRINVDLTPEEDLALCVYHAYSVNAPSVAREVFTDAFKKAKSAKNPREFPRMLLAGLSRSTYGNWQNRYLRTRAAATKSGLWPAALFTGKAAILPAVSL